MEKKPDGGDDPAQMQAGGRAPAGEIPERLRRRLAAAAEGFRDGREIFFMARLEPEDDGDFDLDGPFTREQVDSLRIPDGHRIFGPYATEPPVGDMSRTPVKTITIELHNGETISFDGSRFDALFWSADALARFAAPHYAGIAGVEAAQYIPHFFLGSDVLLIAHAPSDETTLVGMSLEGPDTLRQFPVPTGR